MGLQVRLVHALADRVMELEPHAGGAPLVVGRATEADIHIPSLNVSRRHAMLHAREGGWILQDAGGGRGTFVNGHAVTGAVKLKSGDVVTLGTDPTPATLVIDPYGGAGQARPPAAAEVPPSRRPAAPAAGSGLPQPTAPLPQPSRAMPRAAAPPVAMGNPFGEEPVASSFEIEAAPAEQGDAADEWIAAAATSAAHSPSPKRRPKDQMSGGLIAATALLAALIIGGAVWLVIKRTRDNAATVANAASTKPITPAVRKVPAPVTPGTTETGTTASTGTPGAVASARPNDSNPAPPTPNAPNGKSSIELPPEIAKRPVPAKSAAQAEMDADLNPDGPLVKVSAAAADKYWASVEEAHNVSEPVTAVVIYEDYLRLFPEGTHLGEVKQYMDDALDLLWWQRIADLMKKQQEVQKDLNKKDAEIAAETSADFKEKLNSEKADLSKELDKAANELKEMKYELQDPPNTHDPAALKLLRQGRDAHVYDVWKQAIHLRIKTSRGAKVF